jgi:hypothetical protein
LSPYFHLVLGWKDMGFGAWFKNFWGDDGINRNGTPYSGDAVVAQQNRAERRQHSCTNHPTRKAWSQCVNCEIWMCDACRTIVDDRSYCPDCASLLGASDKLTPGIKPFGTFVACINHPEFRATTKCAKCKIDLCELCQHTIGDEVYCAQHAVDRQAKTIAEQ